MAALRKPLIWAFLMVTTLMEVENFERVNAIWPLSPKVKVQIINNFDPPEDLTLHCKSKNDDKGEHTIKFGEAYEFGFRPNPFFIVTLYFCSFQWPSDTSLHHFDIYVQRRDEHNCVDDNRLCSWKIWKGGACKLDPDIIGAYSQCYPWNPESSLETLTKITTFDFAITNSTSTTHP